MEKERAQLIGYKGKSILIIDISDCRPDDVLTVILKAKAVIARQPAGCLYTITDINGTFFNAKTMKAMKEFTQYNKSYVKAAVVVGVSGIRKLAFEIIANFSQRKFILCDTVAEAKEKLAALE